MGFLAANCQLVDKDMDDLDIKLNALDCCKLRRMIGVTEAVTAMPRADMNCTFLVTKITVVDKCH